MHEKDNYLKTAELSTEQNCNMIDGVPNNTPIPPTPPELDAKPLDKVKEPKERRKGRELERRTSWQPSMNGWPRRAFPTPGPMYGKWL